MAQPGFLKLLLEVVELQPQPLYLTKQIPAQDTLIYLLELPHSALAAQLLA
jgi:hypothetical protein